MSAYKPYKPVRLENRCPHGYDKRECETCVNAEKEADAYWQRQQNKLQEKTMAIPPNMSMNDFQEMKRGKWSLPEMTDYERGVIDGRQMQAKSSVDRAVNSMANKASGTEALVCEDISKRQQAGINKYGTTVCANPLELRAWLQHAYEEALDQAIYLKRAIQELDK